MKLTGRLWGCILLILKDFPHWPILSVAQDDGHAHLVDMPLLFVGICWYWLCQCEDDAVRCQSLRREETDGCGRDGQVSQLCSTVLKKLLTKLSDACQRMVRKARLQSPRSLLRSRETDLSFHDWPGISKTEWAGPSPTSGTC